MSEIVEKNKNGTQSGGESDAEPDPYFEPIIQLPEVKIPSDEETEIILITLRAKIYRFDTGSDDGPEWKERGTGELKLLRNKENHSCRVVMRRDKTLKVCANHFITPWMELKPKSGTDKAFVYTTPADFADEIPKSECLAIRFGSVENAVLFKEKFNEARNIVKTECMLYNGQLEEESDSELSDSDEAEQDEKKEDPIEEKLANLNIKNGGQEVA